MSHLYPKSSGGLYQGIDNGTEKRAKQFYGHLIQLQSTQELDQMIVYGLPDVVGGYGRYKYRLDNDDIQSVCCWNSTVFDERVYIKQMSRLFNPRVGPWCLVENGHDMVLNMFLSLPWDHSTLMHIVRNVFDKTWGKNDTKRLEKLNDVDRLEYMGMAIRQDRFQGLVFAAMSECFRVTERRSPHIIGNVRQELDYIVHF